jgi:hypothetical protein
MPDRRSHRGPDPEDEKLFAPSQWTILRAATGDLCWLLTRGYAVFSALELVGNRYALTRRQRVAVGRCACSDEAFQRRQLHQIDPPALRGQELWLDGYNILIAVEAALSGGVILRGCDGCYRDMAAIHARYREVEETSPALRLIGALTTEWAVRRCRWHLDRPVSNSGRLKQALLDIAAGAGWDWEVELVFNPDKILAQSDQVVATSDSAILDRCEGWINLSRLVIGKGAPRARVIDLCVEGFANRIV